MSPVTLLYAPVSHIEQKVLVTCYLTLCSSFPSRAESSCHLLPYCMFQFPIYSRKFLSPVALLYVPVSLTIKHALLSSSSLAKRFGWLPCTLQCPVRDRFPIEGTWQLRTFVKHCPTTADPLPWRLASFSSLIILNVHKHDGLRGGT